MVTASHPSRRRALLLILSKPAHPTICTSFGSDFRQCDGRLSTSLRAGAATMGKKLRHSAAKSQTAKGRPPPRCSRYTGVVRGAEARWSAPAIHRISQVSCRSRDVVNRRLSPLVRTHKRRPKSPDAAASRRPVPADDRKAAVI